MGRVAVAVGMCVVGVRVEKEATGLGREGEREAGGATQGRRGLLTIQQIVSAAARRQAVRGEREKRGGAQGGGQREELPRFPLFLDRYILTAM